jgi:hypothetical protein
MKKYEKELFQRILYLSWMNEMFKNTEKTKKNI